MCQKAELYCLTKQLPMNDPIKENLNLPSSVHVCAIQAGGLGEFEMIHLCLKNRSRTWDRFHAK